MTALTLRLLVLALLLAPAPIAAQAVTGRVVEAETELPIEDVVVTLRADSAADSALARVVTDAEGRFRMEPEVTGSLYLEASRLGYASSGTVVTLRVGEEVEVVIRLSDEAVPVEPIEVTVRRRPTLSADPVEMVETREMWYGRRGTGAGFFMDAERIREIGPGVLSDVVSRVPGYRLGNYGVRLTSPSRCDAPPTYYVNGRRFVPGGGFSTLTPVLDEIQSIYSVDGLVAVEVYRTSWEAPVEYQNMTSGCGVVAFWYRHTGIERGTLNRAVRLAIGISNPLGPLRDAAPTISLRPYASARLHVRFGAVVGGHPYVDLEWAPRVVAEASGALVESGLEHRGDMVAIAMGWAVPLPLADLVLVPGIGARRFAAGSIPVAACAQPAICSALQDATVPGTDAFLSIGLERRLTDDLHLGLSDRVLRWGDVVLHTASLTLAWQL